MAEFIEVTCNGSKEYINLSWVQEIRERDIYFAFSNPDAYEQDHIRVEESYEEIKRKINKVNRTEITNNGTLNFTL